MKKKTRKKNKKQRNVNYLNAALFNYGNNFCA